MVVDTKTSVDTETAEFEGPTIESEIQHIE